MYRIIYKNVIAKYKKSCYNINSRDYFFGKALLSQITTFTITERGISHGCSVLGNSRDLVRDS